MPERSQSVYRSCSHGRRLRPLKPPASSNRTAPLRSVENCRRFAETVFVAGGNVAGGNRDGSVGCAVQIPGLRKALASATGRAIERMRRHRRPRAGRCRVRQSHRPSGPSPSFQLGNLARQSVLERCRSRPGTQCACSDWAISVRLMSERPISERLISGYRGRRRRALRGSPAQPRAARASRQGRGRAGRYGQGPG